MRLSQRMSLMSLILTGLTMLSLLGCTHEHTPLPDPQATDLKPAVSAPRKPAALPPLVIDTDDPLLLDDAGTVNDTDTQGADNAPCLVCHLNFAGERLARSHAGHEIGCVACHGDSFAHRNDENNTTPPDTMFPAQTIDPFCQKCHKTHDVPAKRIIRRWQRTKLAKADPASIACTQCHGQHRMKVRTVIWDKTSGKLLPNKN